MAQAKHARSTRIVRTTGHAVGGRKVISQAPSNPNVIAGANARRPAPVAQVLPGMGNGSL